MSPGTDLRAAVLWSVIWVGAGLGFGLWVRTSQGGDMATAYYAAYLLENAYDMRRVTGGSSSGGGASVAARLVPAALGGDTVGSIRVPASLCGVLEFKPTPGRWSGDRVAGRAVRA